MHMHKRTATQGLLALLTAVLLPASVVQAASRRGARQAARDRGPAETRSERDKRLQRECQGKPSAGACEGYGR